MKKILCIGEALIDMICTDTGKALSEGQHFLKKPGGAPTNVAAAIAALGGDVELAAKVGADPFGKHLIDTLESFGVSTRWVIKDAGHFTTFAFVSLMESGERDFYFNRGADGQLSIHEIGSIDLDEFSIIHFGSATGFLPGPLQESYNWLLQQAIEKNVFISFDPNYRHLLFHNQEQSFIEKSWHFLHSCHFFKLSDEEAMLITGSFSAEAAADILLKKTNAVFAITLGQKGALLGREGEIKLIPGIPAKVVDTTGAGDAFAGAVLYQLNTLTHSSLTSTTTEEWEKIIYNANKAGARTCEHIGAMEAFRFLDLSE